ncbi:SDR family NAD(P)-dependent oxidoreductase [Yinghuangia soli]|uniref:Glucose 1-dehydrogenase n=1 Tax=Yinghuangia soli TaxID=2908204 RepID=A0AA41U2W3_9ACTN|nr:glucose 1-dehydrogenase [Yinghuangia soli]MCF2531091.1 glucose 1-dehydrogenase [Yinghuangia soli]
MTATPPPSTTEGTMYVYDLKGKVALITGAAQGQGAAEARLFAQCGAFVAIADVQKAQGAALADELGPDAAYIELDVSSEEAWNQAVEATKERFGGLDILVNNAAAMRIVAIEDETADDFRRILDINLLGPFLGLRAVIPTMRAAGGGVVINVASASGMQGQAWAAAYSASKWGVRGLTRTAAMELGRDGIRVNTIVPGPIRTAMLPGDRSGAERDKRFDGLPLGRAGEPEEVAHMAAFLASSGASYTTGADFTVDGGFLAGPAASPRPTAPMLFH